VQPRWHGDPLPDFVRVRRRLFGIAYRILGSAEEAEDIVQDVWLRWQLADRGPVLDPLAFLATATTRLAINRGQSARSRRETCVGPRLPEPVDTSSDPHLGAVRGEALEFAVLLLLQKLSPAERAAYVLREAFDYPYRRIAEVLRLGEANTRQLVARARRHIAEGRCTPVRATEQRLLLEAFMAASRKGDLAALEGLFSLDVVSHSDGGGTGVSFTWTQTNGQPSLRIERDGAVVVVAPIDAETQGVRQILWMMKPARRSAMPNQNKPRAA
jgi:RNA polymerase sigma-70 factor, ECF subfamily